MDADWGELDAQNASTSASKLIGMSLAGGAQEYGVGLKITLSATILFAVAPLE
jgi:hypothetical protein